jgi:hypothetical protein
MVAVKKKNLRKLWEDVNNGKPAPKNESVWLADPKFAFLYAKYIRGTRWSEQEEATFYDDLKVLYNYAYWIVHSLNQDCPEHIHNMMLAKAMVEDKEDKDWVDLFFKLVENKNK